MVGIGWKWASWARVENDYFSILHCYHKIVSFSNCYHRNSIPFCASTSRLFCVGSMGWRVVGGMRLISLDRE